MLQNEYESIQEDETLENGCEQTSELVEGVEFGGVAEGQVLVNAAHFRICQLQESYHVF